jgi:hypothetical protein
MYWKLMRQIGHQKKVLKYNWRNSGPTRTLDAAGQGAAAFNRKIIDLTQRNVNSAFDLAKSLAGAKNLAAIVELQAAYWRKQFDVLRTQAEEVQALSTKVTADAAKPIKSQMARGADGAVKAH